MTRYAAIVAIGLAQASLFGTAALAQGKFTNSQRPPATYTGQWFTAPNGCSYSRAQAPGYPPAWHLIRNPHHIGKPRAKRGCPVTL